ncbi:MAG: phosphotransacetylase [archaeon]
MFGFGKGFMDALIDKAANLNRQEARKIVFADIDDFVLQACAIIQKRRIARPMLLGDSGVLHDHFKRLGLKNLDDDNIIDYLLDDNKEQLNGFANEYLEMRKKDGKILSSEQALEQMKAPHYYGAMLVHKGMAHGMISGAKTKTKPYFPVFEIIKTAPGVNRTSGAFLMVDRAEKNAYFFADCAMNMSPSADVLAEIALLTANTCSSLGMTPKVAMLSFSTRDSAKHESIERIKLATAMIRRKNPDLIIDGEIQADAALVPEVAERKCEDSPLKGEANVLIFPDLNSGNIGYKLVERLGGFRAVGPILQGLRKPVNDLSRGCDAEDIAEVAAITVLQSAGQPALANAQSIIDETGPEEHDGSEIEEHEKPVKAGFVGASSTNSEDRDAAFSRLPSNIRKIIEDDRKSPKKEGIRLRAEPVEQISSQHDQPAPDAKSNDAADDTGSDADSETDDDDGNHDFVNEWKERSKKDAEKRAQKFGF